MHDKSSVEGILVFFDDSDYVLQGDNGEYFMVPRNKVARVKGDGHEHRVAFH